MDLLELMKNETKPLLIVTKNRAKTRLLKRMREERVFHPVRFMSKEDLFQKVFFETQPDAVHQASNILGKKPEVVKPLMRYLYTVDVDASYKRSLPRLLQNLKQKLIERGALRMPRNADSLFESHRIVVYGDFYDALFDIACKAIEPYGVERVAFEKESEPSIAHKTFETLEEEVQDVMISIRRLHEEGVPFSNIAIANAHSAYHPFLMRMKETFSVPLNGVHKRPLYSFPLSKRFLEALDCDATNLYEAFRKALDEIEGVRGKTEEKIKETIRTTINPLVRLESDVKDVLPFLRHLFKHRQVELVHYKDAVECTAIDGLDADGHDYLFIVGTHEGNFPVYAGESDLLDKEDKEEIGFPASAVENAKRKAEIHDLPARFANVSMSFSEKGAEAHYTKSHVVDALKRRYAFQEETPHSMQSQPYSEIADKLHAKALYDEYALYGVENETLKKFYGLFERELDTYDNRFGNLSEATLQKVLPDSLKLSYTKLNTYFECPFRFFLDHLLSIEEREEDLNLALGRFYHHVLETALDEENLSNERLEELLQEHLPKTPTAKERFYLEKSKEAIKSAHAHIREQHRRTEYATDALEGRYEKSYLKGRARLVGVIDKVLRDGEDYVLIDYKSTKPTFDLSLAYYGMSAQLLVYMLLHLENKPSAMFTGFYEQTILHTPFPRERGASYVEQLRDFYKLRGYTLNDPTKLRRLDSEYDVDSFIRNLRTNKDGGLHGLTKQFTSDGLISLLEHTDSLIETAFEKILEGRFDIRPKQDGKNRQISCEYCPFSDVCYRRKRDYQTIEKMKDKEIFKRLTKEES